MAKCTETEQSTIANCLTGAPLLSSKPRGTSMLGKTDSFGLPE